MQSVPGFPSGVDVLEPVVSVRVNGVELPVASVSVGRELSSSLPSQVVAASGLTAATGSVEWDVGDLVSSVAANPWGPGAFPPRPGDSVTIDVGFNGVLVRQLTGVVDSSSGSVADGSVSSSVVDLVDKLNRPVSFPPHMSVLPPWEENGPFLLSNNSPIFTTDRVLRACGVNATPPAEFGAVVSVPLMGSAWPEVGKLVRAHQVERTAFPPSFSQTQWGLGANSIDAEYEPAMSPAGTNRIDDKTFQISVSVRNVTPGDSNTDISAWWDTARLRLRVTSTRQIQAIVEGTVVASISSADAWTGTQFTARFAPGGAVTIYGDNGTTAAGTATYPSVMSTSNLTRVTVLGAHLSSAHIGGLQASFYSRQTYAAPRTAVLTPSASNLGLQVMPAINGRVGLEVLKEQAEAECAAMWLDEFGVFRWVNRNILTGAEPVATLTALDDVFDIGWDSDAKGVRSSVDVKSRQFKITRFPVSSVTLYQGSGESLQSGQSTTDIIEPDADESWFNIDPPLFWTHASVNRGERSMVGGIVSKDGAADVWGVNAGKFTYTWEQINSETIALTHTAGALAAGETMILKTSETDPLLRPFRRDRPLPLIRGKARARGFDVVTTGATLGPADAARLEHEVGPWVQDPAALQDLADWLSVQVAAPRPVLRDLSVVPDPRRQLGDVVWVEDLDKMRIRLKVLVTSLNSTWSNGSAEQSIGGRVLEAFSTVTNQQVVLHHVGRTNQQEVDLWFGATNVQNKTDPLGRG